MYQFVNSHVGVKERFTNKSSMWVCGRAIEGRGKLANVSSLVIGEKREATTKLACERCWDNA